jgi:hypothetical protein
VGRSGKGLRRCRARRLPCRARAGAPGEKITSGIVVEPGPERNADSTTSSSDSVNVNSQADISACEIIGSVTR